MRPNSSPPSRATVSEARTLRASMAAIAVKHRVAGRMAVLVVHRLEAIEIDIDQRGAGPVAFHVGERALELAVEAAPVEQPASADRCRRSPQAP